MPWQGAKRSVSDAIAYECQSVCECRFVFRGRGGADAQQQGSDPSGDLSNDLQDLEQSNDDLASSLSSDQQGVVASKLKDLDKKTKEMQSLAQQLKSELSNPESDPKVIRENTKKLDKLSKEIAKEQHEVASALGISA